MSMVTRTQLATNRGIPESDVPDVDVRQMALGVLMVANLPPDAFRLAIGHLSHDWERRIPGQTLVPALKGDPGRPVSDLVESIRAQVSNLQTGYMPNKATWAYDDHDQHSATIAFGEGQFLILGWYKNRAATEFVGVLDESEMRPPTVEDLESALASLDG